MSAAAGTAVKPRNVDDADASREFFLASVVERLELRGGGEEFFDGYISCNRVVCRLFNRLQLFLSHRTVKVNCDDIVIHVETHVLVLEFRVHKAGKDVLSGVVLHVIETAFPVDLSFDFGACLEGLIGVMNNDALHTAHIGHLSGTERSMVCRLAAAFRVKRGVVKHYFKSVLPFTARSHSGCE